MMAAKKIYLQPSEVVFRGMLDLMDAQGAEPQTENVEGRTLQLSVKMFDTLWPLRFAAERIDQTRCQAALEASMEDEPDEDMRENKRALAEIVLRREFAMLDAMLLIGTPLEAVYR